MDRVEFHKAVFVGDTVSFWTELRHVGTTSISMHVVVENEREGQTIVLTKADVTYVAVQLKGKDRRPVSIRGDVESSRDS